MTSPVYKILLADDNPINLDLATRLLQRRGHEVIPVENGQQVVDRFLNETFDVILLDLEMPVMGGIEAAQKIRAKEKASAITTPEYTPIIAMTAHDEEAERTACQVIGMDGFITKPIDIKTLPQTIQDIIENAQTKRA
ncbi:MAG: response regulator [Nitrospinota bacterium]|jgi:CheY-like chemotaxis protein|nr:response regulator [Nitrospinota bacterium]